MSQEMNQYIGTKRVLARPMNRQAYNDYRGWTLPSNENGADEGMLVEYLDGGQANDPRHKGYISWSPLDVFNRAYRKTVGMTFGEAIEALKAGLRVARAGWNGKGMWLVLIDPYAPHPDTIAGMTPGVRINPYFKAADNNSHAAGTMLPWIGMKTADNKFVPWLSSQTDVLAEDWAIADPAAPAQPSPLDYESEVDKILAQVDTLHNPENFTNATNALMRGLVVLGTYSANKDNAITLADALSKTIREAIPEAFEIAHG